MNNRKLPTCKMDKVCENCGCEQSDCHLRDCDKCVNPVCEIGIWDCIICGDFCCWEETCYYVTKARSKKVCYECFYEMTELNSLYSRC